MLARLPGT